MKKATHPLVQAIVLLSLAAGCVVEDRCAGVQFPAAVGASKLIHVAANCGTADGDGTASRPYATIGQGVVAAQAAGGGAAVVIASGRYPESVAIAEPKFLGLVGFGSVGASATVIAPSAAVGLSIAASKPSSAEFVVQGLAVEGAAGAGVTVQGVAVRLQNLRVAKTATANSNGKAAAGGHGVQLVDVPTASLSKLEIRDNLGTGLLAIHCGRVAIDEPSPSKTRAAGAVRQAGFDANTLGGGQFSGNAGGAIAVVDPVGVKPSEGLALTGVQLAKNARFGIALFGAGATLDAVVIGDTSKAGGVADGLVVAAGSLPVAATPVVAVGADVVIDGSARAGVLVGAQADVQVRGRVSQSALGGLWVQGSHARLKLESSADVDKNSLAGVAVTAGASLDVVGARIGGTVAKTWSPPSGSPPGSNTQVGDGVAVMEQSTVRMSDAKLVDNARAGMVVDGLTSAGQFDLKGVAVQGGEFGIVFNPNAKVSASSLSSQLQKDNPLMTKPPVDATASFSVAHSACGTGEDGSTSCAAPAPGAANGK